MCLKRRHFKGVRKQANIGFLSLLPVTDVSNKTIKKHLHEKLKNEILKEGLQGRKNFTRSGTLGVSLPGLMSNVKDLEQYNTIFLIL